MWAAGYKWIVDNNLISGHIHGGIRQIIKHNYEISKFSEYPEIDQFCCVILIFLFSPIHGLDIALTKFCPQVGLLFIHIGA